MVAFFMLVTLYETITALYKTGLLHLALDAALLPSFLLFTPSASVVA